MYEKKRIKICFGVVVTAILVAAIFLSLRPRPEPFTDTMQEVEKQITFEDVKSCGWVDCF
ncbi:hypothetical protein [Butyrivibrio sp. INlla16]|uniref:hypothetical protein n=1 Tax=Butyrivibrio sp. INlla16 TaxID=1520807 RepID=UPI000885DE20|nr:hypothetical protein [Butyrivibrio sp. INlla16]SDB68501.1 hypothetical protein SAMN02910263_04211 [Butyrivibrio sp. INlla16]